MFGAPDKWSDATISVLICDDAALSRRQLTVALEASDHIEVVAEAADVETALAESLESTPDVVWMGLPLPGPSGARLVSSLLERVPAMRVVVVCGPDDADLRQRSLGAGAFGFARRDEAVADAVAITDRVAWGHPWLDRRDVITLRDAYADLAHRLDGSQPDLSPPRLDPLTAQVLDALAEGQTSFEAAAATGLSAAAIDGAVASSLLRFHRFARAESLVAPRTRP
jgi:DNA-binding NarL/FixJ family response regulator